MKTGEISSRRSHSGLSIVHLSARFPAPRPRHGNLKARLRAATARLATSLAELLPDIILRFATDKDGPPAVPAPVGKPQAGGRHA